MFIEVYTTFSVPALEHFVPRVELNATLSYWMTGAMVRKPIVLSVILVLVFLALSVVWLSFVVSSGKAVSFALISPIELQTNLPGEFGYSVYQLADGSLVLNTSNQTSTFLVKLNPLNQLLWQKPILIDPANTTLPRLQPTADGGFILGGIMNNLYTVVKTDPDGNVEWSKTYNSGAPINYFQSIIQTQDGGYAIAGFGQLVDEGLGWIWFVKTDASGNMEWNRTISGPLADCPSSVFQTSEGGYVLSDVSYVFNPNHAFFRLIKLDASGNVLGSTLYGGEGYYYQPECNFAIATKDGGYLMAGYLWQKNAWAVKTDAQGNMQWNQTYGIIHSSITSALETLNGGYLLVSISNLTNVDLIMTDSEGNQVWKTTMSDVKLPVGLEASFNSIINAKDGGYIMVGSKKEQVWLAEFHIQDSAPMSTPLLPYLEATLAITVVAMVLVATKTGKGRKNQKFSGTEATL